MNREKNIDSILALEKRIEGHKGDGNTIIQLKRTRNSLLNVSTVPPEILGNVFRWNVIPCTEFLGLSKGSFNFLLVCHHWFEVASGTPELWSFWGNSTKDWTHRHTHCRTGPVDLVMDGGDHDLGDQLRDALRDRAARDTIRQVHLFQTSGTQPTLNSIISSIVVEGEEPRTSSVKSFIVETTYGPTVDVTPFFSRYHFLKLRYLRLIGCSISSWDLLKSRITTLTTLKLGRGLSPPPPPSQLLLILSSNPLLQDLSLSPGPDPHAINDDRSSPPVPLRHLKDLHLRSDFFTATFWLLNRLELPDQMDTLDMFLFKCSPSDITQTLGPYFGDRVRRGSRFPGGGLELSVTYGGSGFNLSIESTYPVDDFVEVDWYARASVDTWGNTGTTQTAGEALEMVFDFVSRLPLEEVTDLKTNIPILCSEELCVGMCNLTNLYLTEVDLSGRFADPDIDGPQTFRELLPSLDCLKIDVPTLGRGYWNPLINFLTRRAAIGNRISSLVFILCPRMCPEDIQSVERVVDFFIR